jgi:hypothetical protein
MMLPSFQKNPDPKRILVVSQTNIGDVVLTCPVIDILRRDFPKAKLMWWLAPKQFHFLRIILILYQGF